MTIWGFVNGTQLMAIKLIGGVLYFANQKGHYVSYSTIDGLSLNVSTILEEFPELKGKETAEIKRIARERFKEKIKGMTSPKQIENYLIEDLKKHGWRLYMSQKKGHRPVVYNIKK